MAAPIIKQCVLQAPVENPPKGSSCSHQGNYFARKANNHVVRSKCWRVVSPVLTVDMIYRTIKYHLYFTSFHAAMINVSRHTRGINGSIRREYCYCVFNTITPTHSIKHTPIYICNSYHAISLHAFLWFLTASEREMRLQWFVKRIDWFA